MSGTLSQFKNFMTADVFSLPYGPVFQPEKVEIGAYTFLPWVRNGLATQLANPKAGDVHATVEVKVSVQDDAGGSTDVSRVFTLRGPSDLTGIDSTQIVRRYPQPGSFNVEESYMAHIEFDRPELPWLFTPLQPSGDRLPPWMALVVVEQQFFNTRQGPPGLPWQLDTKVGELQPLDDSWAWAHAQISGTADGAVTVEDRLSDSYGAVNLSRLLCPRKLDPDTNYVACLVPAFDCGVKAGLGQSGGTLGPAWTRAAGDQANDITLPLFDSWGFRTADAGDFESLAKKLTGLTAPWPVGRRIIDFSKPRGAMTDLASGENGRVQVFKCALTSLVPEPPPPPPQIGNSAWTPAKRAELMAVVNTGDQAALSVGKASDLPRVSPRLYARFQRAESRLAAVNDTDWFSQLNTTPPLRVAAGLGTRVVLKDRETLMQAAWAQVGDIDKANQRLALAQFARFTGAAVHQSNFAPLSLGDLSQVTRATQGKIRLGGAISTVAGMAAQSATAQSAMSGAYRRATRLRGPLTRFFGPTGASAMRSLLASGDTMQNFQRLYKEPDGIAGLSANSISYYSPDLIAKVLNVPVAGAVKTLSDAVKTFGLAATIADQAFKPVATWKVRAGAIDLGAIAASNLLDVVEAASPATAAAAPSRSEALTEILSGVSTSGITAAATRADSIAKRIGVTILRTPVVLAPIPAIHPAALSPVALTGPLAGVITHPAGIPLTAAATVATTISAVVSKTGSIPVATAATTLSQFAVGIGTTSLPADVSRPSLAVAKIALLAAIDPKTTVTNYMVARLGTPPSWLAKDWFLDGFVQPIMQAPVFERPMYEALDAYDRDWFIPGLGKITENDLVTVLQTNPEFVETFLVGLSDEMGRELLWRGYPTDSRGTYFKRFWSDQHDDLAGPIHLFSHTALGTHISAASGGASGRLVLLVRGELIRRYPHAIMVAQQQTGTDATTHHPTFAVPPSPPAAGSILFHVPVTPDIFLTGFMLTAQDVKNAEASGHPWWFIIAEHPTAPRFGLQLANPPVVASIARDKLAWSSFGPLRLGRFLPTGAASVNVVEPTYPDQPPHPAVVTNWNAAQLHGGGVARVLLKDPFRAAWNALKLITP